MKVMLSQSRIFPQRSELFVVNTCCCHGSSLLVIPIANFYNFSTGSAVGLDWNELKETLNPEFDWNGAVKKATKSRYSLNKVSFQDAFRKPFVTFPG